MLVEDKKPIETAPAEDVLAWVAETYGERAGLSCSFGGPGGIVLAHMIAQNELPIPLLFVDTEFLFPETYMLKERLEKEWGLEVRTIRPRLTPEQQQIEYGPALWSRNPDLCCRLRKIDPMAELLRELSCWVTALRRDQSPTRTDLERFEAHRLPDGREILKVNPIADWTRKDVWRYIFKHDLPYNPLLDQGYNSLGCTHCTVKAGPNGDERAGRWAGHEKLECGLHTFTKKNG